MTPNQAIERIRQGDVRSVYLLLGTERYFRTRVLQALQDVAAETGIAGLNDDRFDASEADVEAVLSAARTLPMMATRRWVWLRHLERWESKSSERGPGREGGQSEPKAGRTKGKGKGKPGNLSPLAALANYAEQPSETTTLVLTADKLPAKSPLLAVAKRSGFLIECESPARKALPSWLQGSARERGHELDSSAAELLIEVVGSDLELLDRVIEQLSLFVGARQPITEEAVAEIVAIVKPATVWELLDAITQGNTARVLSTLAKVYDPQDRGLRLVSLLLWSTRQLLRFEAALSSGQNPQAAATTAGVPPFKARTLQAQLRGLPRPLLERRLVVLRDLDFALKGGSRRPPRSILESALMDLCQQSRSAAY